MDGKRGTRAQGTDGSDFDFRQQVDHRYEKIGSAKQFIHTCSLITAGAIALTCAFSTINPESTGLNLGIFSLIGLVGFTMISVLVSLKVAQSVVEPLLVSVSALLSLIHLGISGLIVGSCVLTLLGGDFSHALMFVVMTAHMFNMLLSYRGYQAAQEIIENVQSTSKRKPAVAIAAAAARAALASPTNEPVIAASPRRRRIE